MSRKNSQTTIQTVGQILSRLDLTKDKSVSHEFQKYGYDLAKELNDLKHKALYIKLAKETPRSLLEKARNYVKDAYKVKSKARLFMWRLGQLRQEKKEKPLLGDKK